MQEAVAGAGRLDPEGKLPYEGSPGPETILPPTTANPHGIAPVAEPVSSQASANRRGIIAMLSAMSCFTCSDALLKTMTAQLTAGQIMTVRGVFATAIMFSLIVARGEIRQIVHLGTPRVLVRAVLEAVIAFLFIVSLTHLPLANLTAILQATPLIMTLIAVALGLEAVGWRRWSAIAVGFLGVLLIVKPSAAGFNTYAIISLGTAALVAVRDIVTRGIGGHISTTVVTLSTTATVTLLGLGISVAEEWRPIAWSEVGLLGIAAVFVCLGNMAVVQAFRIGEMSVISPFRYAIILTSLVAGFIVFGEWPDAIATCGIVLIVLSGIYTVHREQIRARAAAGTSE